MLSAVSELLRVDQRSERDIAVALGTLRRQMELPDSQVTRFFDFLEDEALARVRLHVTYRLMDAIADSAGTRLDSVHAHDMRRLIACASSRRVVRGARQRRWRGRFGEPGEPVRRRRGLLDVR